MPGPGYEALHPELKGNVRAVERMENKLNLEKIYKNVIDSREEYKI